MVRYSRLIFLAAVLILFIFTGLSAQNLDFARPGPKGIYLFLGKNIPCGKTTSTFRIERRENSGDWKQLAEVKAPVTMIEFTTRIDAAKPLLPAQPQPSQAKLQLLFEKAIRTGTTDSLKGFSLSYPVKLGLGLMYYDAGASSGTGFEYKVTELNTAGQQQNQMISKPIDMPYSASYNDFSLVESSRTEKTVYIKWSSSGSKPAPLFMVHRMENRTPVNVGGTVAHYSMNDTTYYVFQDSLTASQATQELQYFLTPFDLLGNAGKSSQVVAITNDNFSKAFFMKTRVTKVTEKMGIRVSWHFSDPVTVKSMDIYRSAQPDKGFVRLASLSRDDTVYVDEHIIPNQEYYYYLLANSRNGNRFKQSNTLFSVAYHPDKPLPPTIIAAFGINGTSGSFPRR